MVRVKGAEFIPRHPSSCPHLSVDIRLRARRDAYGVRMARVNITVPDDLVEQARAAGLNVSRLASAALAEELDRRAKLAALATYLHELDVELGPVSPEERAAAESWADRLAGSEHAPATQAPPA
jgi:post-segregation antitoxin (ccd killing protein)